MSFEQLISKVKQAEDTLEAQERRVAADMRQFKASWRAGWTPPRIVIAGLVSGFVIGRVEPLKTVAKGGNAMQLITMLSGLFASGSAHAAAGEAEQAADNAEHVAVAVAPQAVPPAAAARVAANEQAAQSAAEAIEP
jgi:hypothetical protein